ncbi:MAG: hypothetical protein U0996_25635 [Planctomycetaceae bacterium]
MKEREDALRREAAKPFWDAQLEFYFSASKAAATIAVTEDLDIRKRAITEFWTLYWGPLACVEDIGLTRGSDGHQESKNAQVERAMVAFGACLQSDPPPDAQLTKLSLTLHMPSVTSSARRLNCRRLSPLNARGDSNTQGH